MRVTRADRDAATVELSRFEVTVLLHAITGMDLADERLPFLPPERQPEVDALYGDLYRLVYDSMDGATVP
jgi:hypothetical protein